MKLSFIISLLFTAGLYAQSLTQKDPLWKKIEARNTAISKAYTTGDVNSIMTGYTQGAALMPEHATTRMGEDNIKQYYTEWLAAARMDSYAKTIYEVQNLDGWALEIGTFTQNFTLNSGKPFEYKGKYMVVWRIIHELDNSPFIAAEIWGANDYINDADFPAISDIAKPNRDLVADKELEKEVKSRNQVIAQLVTERKGAEHAALFMPDAIYMTYYTPMLIGIEKIKPYFVEHEKPGTLKIESIQINTDQINATAGGPVIEYGSYKVDWSDGDTKGTVTGKSINVWKRDANGVLMMYRQMVNHN